MKPALKQDERRLGKGIVLGIYWLVILFLIGSAMNSIIRQLFSA